MKNLREVSIEILRRYEPIEPCEATETELLAIESVLKEVAIQEGEAAVRICDIVHKKQLEEARSSALEQAAKIAASNECSIAGGTEVCNCDIEIAAKIRALMGGG